MALRPDYDAVVVGAGPNGLAAAIRLAQEQLSVLVIEAAAQIGGGTRSRELTQSGFLHDVCSAVHPMALASPFFRELALESHGLEWIHPPLPLAHPLDGGRAAALHPSLELTAQRLGPDKVAYERLFRPLAAHWKPLVSEFLRPIVHPPGHPLLLARFGFSAVRSAVSLAQGRFRTEEAQALFGGAAAHSFLSLDQPGSAAFGLVLGTLGHAVGWPIPRGGAQTIAHALGGCFHKLGGEIRTGQMITRLEQLPPARVILLSVSPNQLLQLGSDRWPARYARALQRYRSAPGVFKIDYALHGPIPWQAQACRRAGTVHLGGTLAELAASERDIANGRLSAKPFVIVAQPSLFDPTRAPCGRHVAWAYCHVPNGSTADQTEPLERQIERFAPGFRDLVLARRTFNCLELERENPNLIGGDISGGSMELRQIIARPVARLNPYRTPLPGVYLCSASTPPGGGVHGMCGFHAAETAIRDWF